MLSSIIAVTITQPSLYKVLFFQISGTPANVENAKTAVEERCQELEREKQDRILKSFALKV